MSDHLELIGQIIEERQRDASAVTESKLQSVIDDLGRKHQEISLEIDAAGVVLMGYADERLEEAHSRNDAYHAKQLQELVECRKGIEVALGEVTTKLAEVKDGEKGETGDPGIAGVDGLDRPLLEPVALIAQKDYDKNTLGTYAGGLWISTKKACGNPDDDPHAWSCILDSMSSMEIDLQEDHTFKLSVKMGTGKLIEDTFKIPYPEHKGVWQEGEYEKGQIVTKGSAFFQAITDTDKAPPGNGWQQILVAPRGKQGPAGKSIQGPQGKPGRNGKDAVLPEGFIDDLLELASNNKAFDDGRSDAYSITSFRGYFSSGESYAAGDVLCWDGALYLCVSGGQFQSIAQGRDSFELMLGVPKIGHVAYMLWQGAWTQRTYAGGHVVRDGEWTMVALTETQDRAGPTAIGLEDYLYQGTMTPWENTVKSVLYGQRYVNNVTAAFLNGYKVDIVDTYHYEVYVVTDIDTSPVATKINDFTATSTGEVKFSINQRIFQKGVAFDLLVKINEPDPTPTTWTGNWYYDTPNNTAIPGDGVCSQSNSNPESLRYSATDDDGGDRYAELAALTIGDRVTLGSFVWTISAIVDNTTWFDFTVLPSQQTSPDGVAEFAFDTVTATPISIGRDVDYWNGNTNVSGLIALDGGYADLTVDDNAYGIIDALIQEGYASPDWDVVTPGSGSASQAQVTVQQATYLEASSRGYSTNTNRITTTDNGWNEVSRYLIPQGVGFKASILVDGKRQGEVGYYSAEWVLLAWNDNGVDYDSKTLGELGVTQCDFRADADGDYIVFEVNGENNKTWEFEVTTFVRELND